MGEAANGAQVRWNVTEQMTDPTRMARAERAGYAASVRRNQRPLKKGTIAILVLFGAGVTAAGEPWAWALAVAAAVMVVAGLVSLSSWYFVGRAAARAAKENPAAARGYHAAADGTGFQARGETFEIRIAWAHFLDVVELEPPMNAIVLVPRRGPAEVLPNEALIDAGMSPPSVVARIRGWIDAAAPAKSG